MNKQKKITMHTRCNMPSLSDLKKVKPIGALLLRRIVGQYPIGDPHAYSLIVNFIRLVHRLVYDYEETRSAIQDFVRKKGGFEIGMWLHAIGCLESCIGDLHRTIVFGQRINRNRYCPKIQKHLPVFSTSTKKSVKKFRHAIQHLDEQIVKGKWQPGEPCFLLVQNDYIELLGNIIYFNKLSIWIENLHKLAISLANYKEK